MRDLLRRSMKAGLWIGVLAGTSLAHSQVQTPLAGTIQATSTLVLVPALVRTPAGELVEGLAARDFRILDNGIEQKVELEPMERQPVSILVVMQTGGDAARQFVNYHGMATMLDALGGGADHETAVLNFDSEPEGMWSFTHNFASLREAFAHPVAGDHGAAVLDAVDAGISELEQRPAGRRRILLLLSQLHDKGSKLDAESVVRRLGEADVTILSVSFSPEKTWLKDQFTKPRQGNKDLEVPNHPPIIGTFDLATPLIMASKAMREDTAAEVATLSGGEHLRFGDAHGLEQELGTLANDIPNRYALSFRPKLQSPGFHSLEVKVIGRPVIVSARSGYWAR